jgi:hypothetical protein
MNFLTESNDNLSKNLKNIVKNIEAMNTSTYDYITAAEEEYKLNGKISQSNIYSTLFAYLDASYFYSMTNFDKKKVFYENSFDLHDTLKELDGEIIKDPNHSEIEIKQSKWDDNGVESDKGVQCDQEKSIVDEIYDRFSNLNNSIEIFKSVPPNQSPNQTRNWTVAPKLSNITNTAKFSINNLSKMTIIPVRLDPIGTKPKSMSTVSNKKCRFNRVNNIIKIIEKDDSNLNFSSIWSNEDSPIIPIINNNITAQNHPSKYKVSKFVNSLVNEFCKNKTNNFTNQKPDNNHSSKSHLKYPIHSCYDYNKVKFTRNQENISQKLIGYSKISSFTSSPINYHHKKYKYRRN